jgi:integrase
MNIELTNFQSTHAEKSRVGKLVIFGETMKRGSLLCGRCSSRRGEKDRSCSKCHHDACYIRVNWQGIIYNFWYTPIGEPFSHSNALKTLYEINTRIKDKSFNPSDYQTSTIKESLFEKAIDRWLAEKEIEMNKGDFAPGTLHYYQSYRKNYLIPFFKGMSVRDITEADIKRFQKSLPDGLSSHYRLNIYRALKTFFLWLFDSGEIREIPKFKKPPQSISRPLNPLSYQDRQEAIFRIPTQHQDLYRYCSEAALRMGEACAMQAGDIDLKRGRAFVQRAYSHYELRNITKGRDPREAVLSDVALEIAQRNIKDKLPGAFLFTWGNGHGYRPAYMRKLWRKYSGVTNTCEEAMRHSTLTDLADLGANAYEIQAIAGHKDIRTSQHYVQSSGNRLRDVVNRRGQVFNLQK